MHKVLCFENILCWLVLYILYFMLVSFIFILPQNYWGIKPSVGTCRYCLHNFGNTADFSLTGLKIILN